MISKKFEISLSDLRFYSRHGVFEQEQKIGNEFTVDLTIETRYDERIEDDDLTATISYADLYEIVREEMETPRKLLETVASKIAGRIKSKCGEIIGGNVTICKSTPPIEGITGKAKVTLIF